MSDIRPTYIAESRILGCLFGQAIGDAMGMPSELWPKRRIINHFGWIERFLPGPKENIAACEFRAAEFTDDTHQCIALMDALDENNGVTDPLAIARHILLWARRCQAFEKNILGPTSKASLIALEQGQPLDEIAANGVKYYIEVANMPTTNDALRFLMEQPGMIVAPSKAVNAGGVATSALEMAQNSERLVWTAEEVDAQLHRIMNTIYQMSVDAAAEYGLGYNLVAGANIAGFKRVAEAMMEQGVF